MLVVLGVVQPLWSFYSSSLGLCPNISHLLGYSSLSRFFSRIASTVDPYIEGHVSSCGYYAEPARASRWWRSMGRCRQGRVYTRDNAATAGHHRTAGRSERAAPGHCS